MINFQDVLKQRQKENGVIWCDEGVYQVAKEIQLLRPDQFGNIFIALGPFHMEKIVLSCLGKYLSIIGMDISLKESGVFGPDVVDSKVMNGGDYVKNKDGFALIAEVMNSIMFKQFLVEEPATNLQLSDMLYDVSRFVANLDSYDEFKIGWEHCKTFQKHILDAYEVWKSSSGNENVQYWAYFIDQVYPIQRDFNHSVRTGDWNLFVSSVYHSLDLFFACGKTNYSRWAPLFYKDLKDMNRKFPDLHKAFLQKEFVMYHSERLGSAVGFDMALEKVYNKPAKIKGGMTRRKEAVALWNLIKHEKYLFVADLSDLCRLSDNDDELNYQIMISDATTVQGYERFEMLSHTILSIGNPFARSTRLHNIMSGAEIPQYIVTNALNLLNFGKNVMKSI